MLLSTLKKLPFFITFAHQNTFPRKCHCLGDLFFFLHSLFFTGNLIQSAPCDSLDKKKYPICSSCFISLLKKNVTETQMDFNLCSAFLMLQPNKNSKTIAPLTLHNYLLFYILFFHFPLTNSFHMLFPYLLRAYFYTSSTKQSTNYNQI